MPRRRGPARLGVRLPARPPALATALFALSLLLFGAGAGALAHVHDACARTEAFELLGAIDAQSAVEAAAEHALGSVVLWSQDDGRVAANPSLAASAEVSVVSYEGDLGLLLPNLAARPDEPGTCVLSSGASAALFRQPDATGSSVLVDGVSYRVVDTMPSSAPVIVRAGDAGAGTDADSSYARLATRSLDADGFPITAELASSVLGARVEALGTRSVELLAHACLFAYPLALALALVGLCRRTRARDAAHPALRLACLATAAAGALGATCAFASALARFGSFYPSTWSDFAAWTQAWQTWTESLARFACARQTVFDEPVIIAAAAAVLLGLAALGTLAAAMLQMRAHTALMQANHVRKQVG